MNYLSQLKNLQHQPILSNREIIQMGLENTPVLGERATYSLVSDDDFILYDAFSDTTISNIDSAFSLTCLQCFKLLHQTNSYTHDLLVWYQHLFDYHDEYLFELQLLCGIRLKLMLETNLNPVFHVRANGSLACSTDDQIIGLNGRTKQEQAKDIKFNCLTIAALKTDIEENGEHAMEVGLHRKSTSSMFDMYGLLCYGVKSIEGLCFKPYNSQIYINLLLNENAFEASASYHHDGIYQARTEPNQVYFGADSKEWENKYNDRFYK